MDPTGYYPMKTMPAHPSGTARYSQVVRTKDSIKPLAKADQYEQMMYIIFSALNLNFKCLYNN